MNYEGAQGNTRAGVSRLFHRAASWTARHRPGSTEKAAGLDHESCTTFSTLEDHRRKFRRGLQIRERGADELSTDDCGLLTAFKESLFGNEAKKLLKIKGRSRNEAKRTQF